MLIQGDANALPLRGGSVQCVVTSPPYWGLRDYGLPPLVWGGDGACQHEWGQPLCEHYPGQVEQTKWKTAEAAGKGQTAKSGQYCLRCGAWRGSLGLEPTPDLYVQHLVEIFREVRRVLRDDGTVWLNLGDSYATQPGKGNNVPQTKWPVHGYPDQAAHRSQSFPGLKPKDLCGIPWRVAFALQADGWYLRSDIIWAKRNPMPESVRDRPTRSHEYVFLLAKAERYYYDAAAVAEPSIHAGEVTHLGPKSLSRGQAAGANVAPSGNALVESIVITPTRNKRSVWRYEGDLWTGSSQPYKGAHFATFPEQLVEPCILAGSRPGDVILDPFCGSGTTVAVADRLGRVGAGAELKPEYLTLAQQRVGQLGLRGRNESETR